MPGRGGLVAVVGGIDDLGMRMVPETRRAETTHV